MRLRAGSAGMALQTKRLVQGSALKDAQFLVAIESKGVMVGRVGPDGVSTGLRVGRSASCVVSPGSTNFLF